MSRPPLPMTAKFTVAFGRLEPGRHEDAFVNDRKFHFLHEGRLEVNGAPPVCLPGETFEVIPHSMRGNPVIIRRRNDGAEVLHWRTMTGFLVMTPKESRR